ncbi:Actin ARP9 [Lecanosticta acicola]|uniref:Actin ARP9 n=1 Tax=Lecanosticta acicola TaxID=111012 RepID=A0AAI8YVF6_9PEZI|nr:Actin ARP9 [Lecanosticta acicola]
MPPFRDDQILIIAPGSQTTLAQLGLPESFTPARYRLRSRMFPAQEEGRYEPVKIRRKDKQTTRQQDGAVINGEHSAEEEWEEDRISEEGAIWPIQKGSIVDWPCFYALMDHVYNTINPPFHTPILLIGEPVWTHKEYEKVCQFFFEKFKTPALTIMDSALAATYAYGIPNATVVDVGLQKADITCIADFMLQDLGRSLAVPQCGGEAMTERLVELLKGRKGFNRDVCEQLKRSAICEVLGPDEKIPEADAIEGAGNPAAAASTGADGVAPGQSKASIAGELPRGPGPGTQVGEEKTLENEEGVLDIASIVAGGNMSEYLAQKEREKQEKAAAKQQKKPGDKQQEANRPARIQNVKRNRNTFIYEDFALHDAMKQAGMSSQAMTDMQSSMDDGPTKEPQSAVSDKPADEGFEQQEVTTDTSPTGGFRREIEVGPERFQAASGGILDRLADAIHRTVQSCGEIGKRSELWDNLIILGNGSKVRGFKEALLANLQAKYIISPSSATIFTSELPSSMSTPMATGTNTPQPQLPGQQHSSSVNPLLHAALTAQHPQLQPGSSNMGQMQHQHMHSSHGQTPTSIKLAKIPEYFPEWKEAGYDEAAFLGAQVAGKLLFVVDGGASKGYMTRTDYNDQGPSGIHEVRIR